MMSEKWNKVDENKINAVIRVNTLNLEINQDKKYYRTFKKKI